MSDEESNEFQEKRRHLTKQERTYGIFGIPESVRQLPINSHPTRKGKLSRTGALSNFRTGQVINPNSQQVEVNVPQKKRKTVTFSQANEVVNIPAPFAKKKEQSSEEASEEEKPSIGQFSLASFLGQLPSDQSGSQKEDEAEEETDDYEMPKSVPEKVKSKLKLYKFKQYGDAENLDAYGLPSQFGEKRDANDSGVPRKRKTKEQQQLQQQYKRNYGKGFKMMEKLGFKVGEGLGKDGTGIKAPVEAVKKTALLVQDDLRELRRQKQQQKEQQSEKSEDEQQTKGPTELFEYFSLDKDVQRFLRNLQNQYELYDSIVQRQEAEVQKQELRLETSHAELLQRHEQAKQLNKQIDELEDLKKDMLGSDQKYPHLALEFNLDLLVVKNAMEQVRVSTVEELVKRRSELTMIIDSTCYRLQQIYLRKAKESIKNFTEQHTLNILLKSKVIDLEKLQQQAALSEEDVKKINNFTNLVLEDSLMGVFEKGLAAWDIDNHSLSEHLIAIFELVRRYNPQAAQQLIRRYIVPEINRYLSSFLLEPIKRGFLLPHLMVFPWFGVCKAAQLDLDAFAQRIHALEWSPEGPTGERFIELLKPWKPYLPLNLYSDIIFFTVGPRILKMMKAFQVSASANDDRNILRLKAVMKYAGFVPHSVTEIILEDTLIPELKTTLQVLMSKQSKSEVSNWLQTWKRTVVKLCHTDVIVRQLDQIQVI